MIKVMVLGDKSISIVVILGQVKVTFFSYGLSHLFMCLLRDIFVLISTDTVKAQIVIQDKEHVFIIIIAYESHT